MSTLNQERVLNQIIHYPHGLPFSFTLPDLHFIAIKLGFREKFPHSGSNFVAILESDNSGENKSILLTRDILMDFDRFKCIKYDNFCEIPTIYSLILQISPISVTRLKIQGSVTSSSWRNPKIRRDIFKEKEEGEIQN